jgi:hypothetical protein
MLRIKALFEGIQGASTNITEHHANGGKHHRRKTFFMAIVLIMQINWF